MKARVLFLTFFLCSNFLQSQAYLNQKPPGLIPELFASEIFQDLNEYEFGSVFTTDGLSFFYAVDEGGKNQIRYMEYKNGQWTKPEVFLTHPMSGRNDPMFTMDENRLFFISNQGLEKAEDLKDIDIWYVEKTETGWSDPINVGAPINSDRNEFYISFSQNGTLYFSSNRDASPDYITDYDIFTSKFVDGKYQEPVKLPGTINTKAYEADVFVAPDESYIIFATTRRSGYGRGDLYISFKDEDGAWRKAKNMGPTINSKENDFCPFVTRDGKYFFFTSNEDIYWVDAKIIESYR